MALNPFFLQGSSNEQYLVQDLINEQLKIYGIDIHYIPRKFINTDNIFKEVEASKFDDNFVIEAYLNNYDGYSPESDIMTKFGLRLKNEVNLIISRERFEEFITPFLESINSNVENGNITDYEVLLSSRPKEGDLIYFPLGERLFEVKRVENEKPFYQLGKNYVYELQCELYEYENELINTSVEEIDNTVKDEGYITTLVLAGSAVTATVSADINYGSITEIFLNNDGSGYTSQPTITFSESFNGTTASAVAITTTKGNVQSVERIELINAGSGYTTPPKITISGGGGSGAAATCSIGGTQFSVSSLNIINPGIGYATTPEVIIDGPGIGVTATAVAGINSNTNISYLRIINSGIGYTQSPEVSFSGFSTIGVGTFIYNEEIIGQTSGVTARVKEFEAENPGTINYQVNLKVSLNTGKFSAGEIVVGSISSSKYVVRSHSLESYDDPYDTNEEIETEADSILDFSESNPFGEY